MLPSGIDWLILAISLAAVALVWWSRGRDSDNGQASDSAPAIPALPTLITTIAHRLSNWQNPQTLPPWQIPTVSWRSIQSLIDDVSRSHQRLWSGMAGFGLLILANRLLNRQEFGLITAALLVAGVVLWWRFAGTVLMQRDRLGRPARDRLTVTFQTRIFIGITVAAALVAWIRAGDGQFDTAGIVAWLVAIVAWLVAWWPNSEDRAETAPSRSLPLLDTSGRWALALVITATIALGVFLRYHRLDGVPLDPTSDHAEKLLDVSDVLAGQQPIFFERNTGREPGQFYLTAAYMRFFDLPTTFASLKLGTAAVGALAIPFVYLLASEFGGRLTGVFAALLFAVSKWTVAISRAGLRFPFAVLPLAASLWLLLRWMRRGSRRDAIGIGMVMGAGLYGYSTARLIPLVIALGFFFALVDPRWKGIRRQAIEHAVLAFLTAAIVFVPLGRYAWDHPDAFFFRARSTVEGDGSIGMLDNLRTFARNNWNAALAFNWEGDIGFVNMVTNDPFLDLITGALLLAGMVAILITVLRWRDMRAVLLLLSLPVLALGSTLALTVPSENPSVNRMGQMAPVIMTIAALPLALIGHVLWSRVRDKPASLLFSGALIVLLSIAAVANYRTYFVDFDRQTRSSVANTTAIGQTVLAAAAVGLGPGDVYIIDYPHWMDTRNIGFYIGDSAWPASHNVLVDQPLPSPEPGKSLMMIFNPDDEARMLEAQMLYPSAVVSQLPGNAEGHGHVTFWIPPI